MKYLFIGFIVIILALCFSRVSIASDSVCKCWEPAPNRDSLTDEQRRDLEISTSFANGFCISKALDGYTSVPACPTEGYNPINPDEIRKILANMTQRNERVFGITIE
jgi:hypothetical protein